MSLTCAQCRESIEYGSRLRAVVGFKFFSALCHNCLKDVPVREEGDLPLHYAVSERCLTGAYSLRDFTIGDQVGWLLLEDIKDKLPEIIKLKEYVDHLNEDS